MGHGKDRVEAETLAAWDDDIEALERVLRNVTWSPDVFREITDRMTSLTDRRDILVTERRARGKRR